MSSLFDSTTEVLAKSLDLYLVRHSVITDNIANAETPGFKARSVDFEKQLQRAVEGHELGNDAEIARELSSFQPTINQDADDLGNDGNTVDMDRQMAALTKNDLKYSAATQAVNRKFHLLKYAITGAE